MASYNRYPDEIVEYVRQHAGEYTVGEMAEIVTELFGRPITYKQMRTFFKNHKFHAKPMKGRTGRSKYPEGMGDYIRSIAGGRSCAEIAQMVNEKYGEDTITKESVNIYKKNHGIRSGLDTRFSKGIVPFNKGKHPATVGRMAETQFKKGNRPHNARPVGSERNLIGYVEVKVAEPNVWKLKHRVIWEQHHGPIPEDGLIRFKDGNPMNLGVDNLMLVTRKEHAQLTGLGLRSGDPEITNAGLNVVRLKNAAEERRKQWKR